MATIRFSVDTASRQVNCKGCPDKVEKDSLRMGRRSDQYAPSYYHPACLFASFGRVRAGTSTIQSLADIEGLESVSDAGRRQISFLLSDWIHTRKQTPLRDNENVTAKEIQRTAGTNSARNSAPGAGSGSEGAVAAAAPVGILKRTAGTNSARNSALGAGSGSGGVVAAAVPVVARPSILKPTPVGLPLLARPIVVSDDDDEEEEEQENNRFSAANFGLNTKRPRLGQTSGDDECSVCLEQPVHPVSLPCTHIFCYLCAKGLVRTADIIAPLCSLCRRPFPRDYLDSAQVVAMARRDVNQSSSSHQKSHKDQWQWFYQGKTGWWRFEERNSLELEQGFMEGLQSLDILICGSLYTVDFVTMEQYQKNFPTRRRRIKRDLESSDCRGVAGLHADSGKRGHSGAIN